MALVFAGGCTKTEEHTKPGISPTTITENFSKILKAALLPR